MNNHAMNIRLLNFFSIILKILNFTIKLFISLPLKLFFGISEKGLIFLNYIVHESDKSVHKHFLKKKIKMF